MPVLTERVCRTIDRYRLLPPGAGVLVAVSGGADSTALVFLLRDLAPRLGIRLVGLAHFNHLLRGGDSDGDERFCREMAERLDLRFESGRGDVRAAARQSGTSVEDAGRRLRYEFLVGAVDRLGASHLAVGHTRDDQAETLLLNLLRGQEPRGLGGMPARRGVIVRPLIDCTHRELVEWLSGAGETFREDESNLDRRHLRNRVRHDVLPVLSAVVASARDAMARAAEIARADAEYLDGLAAEALARASRQTSAAAWEIDAAPAGGHADGPGASRRPIGPRAGRRRPVRRFRPRRAASRTRRREADRTAVAAGPVCTGRRRRAAGARFAAGPRPGRRARCQRDSEPFSSRRCLYQERQYLDDGRAVSSELRLGGLGDLDRGRPAGGAVTATIDADLAAGLAVRFRRPGDRFRPLGLAGHKKLQDFFVDRKVPRAERARTPLVVDAGDRVVWVAGYAVSEDFRVSERTRAVVILKLRGERV